MTDLSWSHLLILMVVALVVVGPKDLPKIMRKLGQWTAQLRGMADQFRKSFDDMARESELEELRQQVNALKSDRPLADMSAPIVNLEEAPKAKK